MPQSVIFSHKIIGSRLNQMLRGKQSCWFLRQVQDDETMIALLIFRQGQKELLGTRYVYVEKDDKTVWLPENESANLKRISAINEDAVRALFLMIASLNNLPSKMIYPEYSDDDFLNETAGSEYDKYYTLEWNSNASSLLSPTINGCATPINIVRRERSPNKDDVKTKLKFTTPLSAQQNRTLEDVNSSDDTSSSSESSPKAEDLDNSLGQHFFADDIEVTKINHLKNIKIALDAYIAWMGKNAQGTLGWSRFSHWFHGKDGLKRATELKQLFGTATEDKGYAALANTDDYSKIMQRFKAIYAGDKEQKHLLSGNHRHSLSRYFYAACVFGENFEHEFENNIAKLTTSEFSKLREQGISVLVDANWPEINIYSEPSSTKLDSCGCF